jgi:hypothetical protein
MARVQEQGGRHVYRPVFARVLLVLAAAFCLWVDADLLLKGRIGEGVLAALWTVAALAALAAVFWRPAVVVDEEAAELRNVLRDVRVPWGALEAVDTRYALTLVAGGRRHQSWAAVSRGRPPRRRPSDGGSMLLRGRYEPVADDGPGAPDDEVGSASRHPRTASGATAYVVEERWRAWQQGARTRALLADTPGADTPGTDGPGAAVVVRWRPHLLVVAAGAAALAVLLGPVLG